MPESLANEIMQAALNRIRAKRASDVGHKEHIYSGPGLAYQCTGCDFQTDNPRASQNHRASTGHKLRNMADETNPCSCCRCIAREALVHVEELREDLSGTDDGQAA